MRSKNVIVDSKISSLRMRASTEPVLDAEYEHELGTRAQRGEAQAAERLVRSHMRLVFTIAGAYRHCGVAWDELISEGMLGLMLAAQHFDPEHRTRFGTYAKLWVRALLRRYTQANRRIVRAPSTRKGRRALTHVNRVERELSQSLGAAPDREAIARSLGVSVEDVEEARNALYTRDLPIGDAAAMFDVASGEPSPEQLVIDAQEHRELRRLLAGALAGLERREPDILRARHLVDPPASLRVIGAELGVSRERVRQLESRACEKLRAVMLEPVVA